MQLVEQLLQLPTLLGAFLLMATATLLSVFLYLLSNRLLGNAISKDSRRAADYLFRAVGILVSLFLSLTFADVVLELNQIESSIEREAVLIEDIHSDLGQYDSARAHRARVLLVDYTRAVIEHDWPALANDSLSREAQDLFRELEFEILRLQDDSELESILRARVLSDIDQISDLRLNRVEQALAKPPLFLVVVIFGFLVSVVCFGPHDPRRSTLVFLSLYTMLIGLVIYLILAYSDPFQGDTQIEPVSLQFVLQRISS